MRRFDLETGRRWCLNGERSSTTTISQRSERGAYRRVPRRTISLLIAETQVNSQMLKLTGRILPPPQVLYGGGQTAQLQNGSWNLRHNQVQYKTLDSAERLTFVLMTSFSRAARHPSVLGLSSLSTIIWSEMTCYVTWLTWSTLCDIMGCRSTTQNPT